MAMSKKYLYGVELCFGLLMVLIAYYISLRLVVLILLFLISLLNIFKAPTTTLWLVGILANEYSIVFMILTIVTMLTGIHAGFSTSLGTILGLIALVLFASPLIRAYLIAQQLPASMRKALGGVTTSTSSAESTLTDIPFSFLKLFQTVPKEPHQTFTYVTYDDTTLKLDYYASRLSGKRPCVVVIHGGSWSAGDSKQLPELNSHLARAGYHVVAINYRLVPQWKYPAPIDDTVAALKYLREHADELNIDVENFILLGRSAGGQIALLTAYKHRELGIKGAVNFYGPADMIWGYMVSTNPLVLNSRKTLAKYIGGDYHAMPEKYRESSPIEFVTKDTVPTLMFHGALDALVFDSHDDRLDAKLKESKVPHYYLQLPWAAHGFDYHLYGPGGQLSTYAIEYFLRAVTKQ